MKRHRLFVLLLFFLLGSILFSILIPKFFYQHGNKLYKFLFYISEGYQFRQIIAIILVFLSGIPLAVYAREGMKSKTEWVFWVFPIGIAEWMVLSICCLILGVGYNVISMICLELLFNFPLIYWMLKKNAFQQVIHGGYVIFPALIFCCGIICILSSGLTYVWVDYDGNYFIIMLGKTLASVHKLTSEMSTYLQSTMLGVSTISSLSYFFYFDNMYIIHHYLMICFIIIIGMNFFRKSKTNGEFILLLILFISSPMLLYYMFPQLINNAYLMVYLTLLILLLEEGIETGVLNHSEKVLSILLCSTIIMIRADAAIVLCCTVIALYDSKMLTEDIFRYILFPSFASWCLWYLKIFFLLGGFDGLYINLATMIPMFIFFVFDFVVFYCVRGRFCLVDRHYKGIISFFVCFIAFPISYILKPDETNHNMLNTFRHNLTFLSDPKQFGPLVNGGFWGVSVLSFLIMLFYVHAILRKKMNSVQFIFIVLCYSTYFLGYFRGLFAGQWPRGGFGDSFNRALISYVPVFYIGIVNAMKPDKKCCPDMRML